MCIDCTFKKEYNEGIKITGGLYEKDIAKAENDPVLPV